MKLLNGKYKIRNRIMAAFLAVTMLLTLVPTGQMQVYAAGEGKVNVDSFAVKVNGVPLENVTEIKEGDIIGIHNGRIEVVGKSIHDIALELVKHVVEDGDSLITIYYGQDTQQEDADALGAEVAEMFSDLDVEVQYGGQPLYYYLISAE